MRKGILGIGLILLSLTLVVGNTTAASEEKVEPIVLGNPQSLGFEGGRATAQAVTLAVEEINAAGGVNVAGKKRPFKLVTMDSRDTEPGVPVSEALLVIEKLILQSGAQFIVAGPARSEAALAMMDLLLTHKKININSLAMSPALGFKVAKDYEKYKYFFTISNLADWMVRHELGSCMVGLAKKFGLSKIFIIVQDVAHARAAGEGVEKMAKAIGWEVAGHEIYPTGSTDFSSGLLKARAAGKCILFVWGEMSEFTTLLRQWHDMKVPALPIGMVVVWGEPGLWKATKGKCEYIMSDQAAAGNAISNATPWTMKFYEAYQKRWGKEPEFHGTAEGYMAPYVVKDAVERAGTIDSDRVVKALEQTDMVGVYGRIRFDPKTHRVISSLDPKEGTVGVIFQWQDGKRVGIFPPAARAGEVKLPPWVK